jgi:nucleotide-binding universal stress UspA family protein
MTERVLVATDGSAFAQAAVMHAWEIARRNRARLTVLHVLPGMPSPALGDVVPSGLREHGWRVLEGAAAALPQGVAELALVEAAGQRVADVIAREAVDRDAELIVLGSHGTSGWDPHLLGSVAERVSHNATPAVLLVRGDHLAGQNLSRWR